MGKDRESRVQRREGETKFFPSGLPRRLLSYPKIEIAGCKGERKMKFFPEGFAEGPPILSKDRESRLQRREENEVFPRGICRGASYLIQR